MVQSLLGAECDSRRALRVGGVPTVMGGKTREAIVYLDPQNLREYTFSPVRGHRNKLNAENHLCACR